MSCDKPVFRIINRISSCIMNAVLRQKWGSDKYYSSTTILDLPSEILLMIFKLLPENDLLHIISSVCKRWSDLVAIFWSKIVINKHMSKEVIHTWITKAAAVKHLEIRGRRDVNEILGMVLENCTALETLVFHYCTGSRRSSRLRSCLMCHLITNFSNLSFIHLIGTRFNSCKFFSILPELDITYFGGITYRELIVLLQSAKLYVYQKPVAIGIKTIKGRFKINLDHDNIVKLLKLLENKNKDTLILIMWSGSNELFSYHFNITNPNFSNLLP